MLRPKDVVDQLGISPATLRLWSTHFAPVLSPAAQKSQTEQGTPAQRRYTDEDVAYFRKAKELLASGKTYEETLGLLLAEPVDPDGATQAPEEPADLPPPSPQTTLSTLDEHPIFLVFRQALDAKDEVIAAKDDVIASKEETIETLNRELLTVQASKDELIASLQDQLEVVQSKVAIPTPISQSRFRWEWLNRLLLSPGGDKRAHIDGSS